MSIENDLGRNGGLKRCPMNETQMQKEQEISIHYDISLHKSQEVILLNNPPIERVREITKQPEPPIQMVG